MCTSGYTMDALADGAGEEGTEAARGEEVPSSQEGTAGTQRTHAAAAVVVAVVVVVVMVMMMVMMVMVVV